MLTALPPPDLLPVFNAQPGATLLLSPQWVIVGASDDYLAATLTERASIVGRFIFDAFPDNPDTPEADAVANVRASLMQVMATRQPHEMAPQHYDVPDPARPGRFVERHWLPRHTPVLDGAGQVQFIIQSVQDITARHRAARQLRESQADEQTARADAELQRQRLHEVLMQLPAHVAVYHGPDHVYQFVNPPYQRMFPHRSFVGKPFREGTPEAQELGVVALFDRVYQTGEPYYGHELEGWFDFRGTGEPEQLFFNLYLHPLRNARGEVDGVLDFSYDVTEQVRARRQVEQLNQELEARVRERTAQLSQQSQRLERLFMQAPASICLLAGPELVYEYVNPIYQQLFPGRQLLGRPLLGALPELADHAAYHTIRRVFETGETNWQHNLHTLLARPGDGVLEDRYWSYVQQPRYDEHGRIDGIVIFGYEVTEQVEARQQTEALQAEALASTQRQVRERATLYQVFEETPALICILRGPAHRYDYFNAAYQRQFASRELAGRPVAEALPETVEQGFIALLDKVYQTGETYFGQELQLTIEATDDAPAQSDYYNLTYQAYREDGQIRGVCVFAYVVTAQVEARRQNEALQAQVLAAARRQAQERETFFKVFAQTPALIALLRSPGHRFEYVNQAYQAVFPGRQLVGLDVAVAAPEMVQLGFVALLDTVYQTGETFFGTEVPFAVARPGQEPSPRYFDLTYQAYQEDGQTAGIAAYASDVTEQVLARREREAQRQRLERLFMQAPAAVCILHGPDLVYELVNPSYQALFPGRALLGKPLLAALPEIADHATYHTFRQVYDTGLTHQELGICIPLARPEDDQLEDRYFNYIQQARYDQHGHIDGILVFAFEVTEQVRARQQTEQLNHDLSAANQQLTRTNADLDTFIYTASHDLKAPISNIEGLLYVLREELPADVLQGEYVGPTLTRMLAAVERFKRTIDHLTEVSKLQKEHAPATALVNLAAVVEDVRQDLLPLLQAAGAKLTIDVAARPPVQFSEKNLRSIVYNLLSNAVKYRHPDRTPHVDVRTHVRNGHTVLEVHDNGLGLAEHQLPRLFGMFQRFHDHVEGTGIGLYMVKKMVENAGGRIEVHSQFGAGTTFFIFLPHATGPGAPPFPAFVPS